MLNVGTAGVDWVFVGLGVGRPEFVTLLVGVFAIDAGTLEDEEPGLGSSGVSGRSGNAFLVLPIGSAGSGPVGGAVSGGGGRCEGRCGIAEVIVTVADIDTSNQHAPLLMRAADVICIRPPADCSNPSILHFGISSSRSLPRALTSHITSFAQMLHSNDRRGRYFRT